MNKTKATSFAKNKIKSRFKLSSISLLRNKSATLTFEEIIEAVLAIFVGLLLIWFFLPFTLDLYEVSASQMNYADPMFVALWSNFPVIIIVAIIIGLIIGLVRRSGE